MGVTFLRKCYDAAVETKDYALADAAKISQPVKRPDRPRLLDFFESLTPTRDRWIVAISVLLAAIVWVVFGQTLGHDFVNFDDETYVYGNAKVARGLTLQGVAWSFTHILSSNWHPLTVISHMLDCQLYGLRSGGHHFTNVLLHTIAAILLFLVLRQMTGALWRSAFIAAVFAIHPLRVESVAWIAERKDVLSAVFFMLTLGAYVRYVRQPSFAGYLSIAVLFALGLMCKPMLVTLPFVLLLLDYWPLNRFARSESPRSKVIGIGEHLSLFWRLVVEKIPLLVLSAASSVGTLLAQRQTINLIEELSLPWRVGNAFVTFITYIRQMALPVRLAPFYPHPRSSLPLWEVTLSIALLILISAVVLALRQKRPYLLTGWLWYLAMLVPVSGVVQVGLQAHADRYTYLPQIGLYLLVTWTVADLSTSWRHRRAILSIVTTVLLVALTWLAWIQTSYWRDSVSLWRRALAVTSNNVKAHNDLAGALMEKGLSDEAILQAQMALNIQPGSVDAYSNLGAAYSRNGQPEQALAYLRKVLEIEPKRRRLHFNIATALLQKGDVEQAIAHYQKELQIQPDFAEAHNNLASALFRKGHPGEAFVHVKKALELKPNYAQARNNLAIALSQKGQMNEAIAQWEQTLETHPGDTDARCNLAWVFATYPEASIRNGARALTLAQSALQLSGGANPRILRLVAAAYAENGQFPEAIEAAQKALQWATAQGDSGLAQTLEMNIALFQTSSPLRDTGQTSTETPAKRP